VEYTHPSHFLSPCTLSLHVVPVVRKDVSKLTQQMSTFTDEICEQTHREVCQFLRY